MNRLIDRFAVLGAGVKGKNVSLDLDQATLVIGESGSGKTRLLGALGLGLHDKQKGPPSPGAPLEGETVVEVTGPGLSISRTIGPKRSLQVTHGRAVEKTIPAGQKLINKVLGRTAGAVQDLGAFLGLSADKQRALYLQISGVSLGLDRKATEERLLNALPDEPVVPDGAGPASRARTSAEPVINIRGLVAHLVKAGSDGQSLVDWCATARAVLATKRKETDARAKQAKKTVETMPELGPDRLPPGRLEGAKARLAETRGAVSAVEGERRSVLERAAHRQRLLSELTRREAEEARLLERLTSMPVVGDDDPTHAADISKMEVRLAEQQTSSIEHEAARTRAAVNVERLRRDLEDLKDGKCPKCGATGEHIQSMLAELQASLRTAEISLQFAEEDIEEVRAGTRSLTKDLAETRQRLDKANARRQMKAPWERALQEMSRVRQLLDALPEQSSTDIDQRLAEAKIAAEKAQTEHDLLVERAGQEKMDARAMAMLDHAKAYLAYVKTTEKEVRAIEQEILEAAAEVVTARANEIVGPVCGEGWSYFYDIDRALTGLVKPGVGEIRYDNLAHGEQAIWAIANLWAMVSQEPWPALVADRLEVMRTSWLVRLLRVAADLMDQERLHACLLGARYSGDQADALAAEFVAEQGGRVVRLSEEEAEDVAA